MIQVCWRPLLRLRGPFRFCLVLLRKSRQGIFECRQRLIMRGLMGLWALVGERQETSSTKKSWFHNEGEQDWTRHWSWQRRPFLGKFHLALNPWQFLSLQGGAGLTLLLRKVSVKSRVVFAVLFHNSYVLLWCLGMPSFQKSAVFFNIVQTGGVKPMFKNYVGNCRVFWRSFNNMKFAWKGTFEALMVKFGGEIGTLYQIFTPCTPLPKYKRAFTWFLGGSNSLPGCRRIFYRGLP